MLMLIDQKPNDVSKHGSDLLLVMVPCSGDQWKAALLHLESLDKAQLEGNVISEGSVLASGD